MNSVRICNICIHNIDIAQVLVSVEIFIRNNKPVSIVTPNVDHIVKLQNDEEFYKVYQKASLILADGVPILWGAAFLGTPLKEKISGSDLFPKLCEVAAQKEWKVFFMGGREGAANSAAKILTLRYPGLKVVGVYCPPLGFENDPIENIKIIELIKAVRPDIVFVGVGAPKQEKWIDKHKDEYAAPVSIGIGVSFEFVSGMVKRAPIWMQKIGLEWFWRLCIEPRRLWKRYLVDDIVFFKMLWNQKYSGKKY